MEQCETLPEARIITFEKQPWVSSKTLTQGQEIPLRKPRFSWFYWYSALGFKPKHSSVVPMDLVNTVESICNALEKKERKQMFA